MTEKKKKLVKLVSGIVLLILGVVCTVLTRQNALL